MVIVEPVYAQWPLARPLPKSTRSSIPPSNPFAAFQGSRIHLRGLVHPAAEGCQRLRQVGKGLEVVASSHKWCKHRPRHRHRHHSWRHGRQDLPGPSRVWTEQQESPRVGLEPDTAPHFLDVASGTVPEAWSTWTSSAAQHPVASSSASVGMTPAQDPTREEPTLDSTSPVLPAAATWRYERRPASIQHPNAMVDSSAVHVGIEHWLQEREEQPWGEDVEPEPDLALDSWRSSRGRRDADVAWKPSATPGQRFSSLDLGWDEVRSPTENDDDIFLPLLKVRFPHAQGEEQDKATAEKVSSSKDASQKPSSKGRGHGTGRQASDTLKKSANSASNSKTLPSNLLPTKLLLAGTLEASPSQSWVPSRKGQTSTGRQPGEGPFRLDLTCGQATTLLNFLALGYAATAVVAKAVAGESSTAASALSLPELSLFGGCLDLATSLDFAARFSLAALASAGLWWMTRKQKKSPAAEKIELPEPPKETSTPEEGRSGLVLAGVELGFWMFITYAAQAVGLQTASAHDAALILTSSVILVPFLEALMGSRLQPGIWGATLLASCGLLLLEGGDNAQAAAETVTSLASLPQTQVASSFVPLSIPCGHIWCLLGSLGSAVHVVRSEQQCSQHSPLELVVLQLMTTASLSLLWLSLSLSHLHLSIPNSDSLGGALDSYMPAWASLSSACSSLPWGMLLLSGPIGTGLCEWLELEALEHVKASTATLILTASPLWAALIAFFVLGETMTPASLAGAGLILAASLQVQRQCNCKEQGS